MRILMLVDSYPPHIRSGAIMMRDLGVELQGQGHDVTVLTPSDAVASPVEMTVENGLRVVRVRTRSTKTSWKALRAIREARLSSTLWTQARPFLAGNQADLIIFYSPTIFFGPLVRRMKSLWSCPAYLILRDIFPQWAVDTGIMTKGFILRYFQKREAEQYEVADSIGIECPSNLQYFARTFSEQSYRLEVLYNWAAHQNENVPPAGYREKLGLQEKVIFLYGGNIGVVQDLDNIVRLATRLADHKQIHFLLVGDGSEASRLERLIAEKRLCNIQVLRSLRQEEYLSLLSEVDVGLISLDRRLTTYSTPGKMLGYMECGKPMLASVSEGNDLFWILEKYQAGFCVLNGGDDDLADATLTLAGNQELRTRMGQNSRKLLERLFSVKSTAGQIVSAFQEQGSEVKARAAVRR